MEGDKEREEVGDGDRERQRNLKSDSADNINHNHGKHFLCSQSEIVMECECKEESDGWG